MLVRDGEGGDPRHLCFRKGLAMTDMINHPPHYTSHPAGIECIDVIEWFPANIACAMKYLWRAGLKGDASEDLQKAVWYVSREIQRLEKTKMGEKQEVEVTEVYEDEDGATVAHTTTTIDSDTTEIEIDLTDVYADDED